MQCQGQLGTNRKRMNLDQRPLIRMALIRMALIRICQKGVLFHVFF